jgi:hypothetical protein
MEQVILYLIDFDSHLFVISSIFLKLVKVGFDVLLALGYGPFVSFSLFFQLDACLPKLTPKLLHVFGSHREATRHGPPMS